MINREQLMVLERKHDIILIGISPFDMKDNCPLRLRKQLDGKYIIEVNNKPKYETYEREIALITFNKYYADNSIRRNG